MNNTIHKVLILDDDAEFADHLAGLLPSRFQAKAVYTAKQAMAQLTQYPFDSIISDFILAEDDGVHFLKSIQSLAKPPKVVFVTAFANKDMAISLLNLGAQGLLEKPFAISTLTELLEKSGQAQVTPRWVVHPATRVLTTEGIEYELTEVEFKVIAYLLTNMGQWISREQLLDKVWGSDQRSRNVLDTHLTNLKRKVPNLKDAIKVVRGRGYILENTVRE